MSKWTLCCANALRHNLYDDCVGFSVRAWRALSFLLMGFALHETWPHRQSIFDASMAAFNSEDGSDGAASDKSDLFGCVKDTLSADKDKLAMPPPSLDPPSSPTATPGREPFKILSDIGLGIGMYRCAHLSLVRFVMISVAF